jgi:hypothetical protein
MPRTTWQLVRGRPVIEVSLVSVGNVRRARRTLLADTGAGSTLGGMELILTEADRRRFSVGAEGALRLGGAFIGSFPTFWIPVTISRIGFSAPCVAVAVPSLQLPSQLQGIACFRFLNRFTYGNFADLEEFGLEAP